MLRFGVTYATICEETEKMGQIKILRPRPWQRSMHLFNFECNEVLQVTIRTVDSSDKDIFIDQGLAVVQAWLTMGNIAVEV